MKDLYRSFFFLSTVWLLTACNAPPTVAPEVARSQEIVPEGSYPTPEGDPVALGLAGYAKVLCSAVFISEREPEEAVVNSGFFLLPEAYRSQVSYQIDREEKVVEMRLGDTLLRKAKYYGDQGCIICKDNEEKIFFEPVAVESSLPDPASSLWPMGDSLPSGPLPAHIDRGTLREAVDLAFSPPDALTAAFLVVYDGQIIAERYGQGADMHTQLESWSMGKSLTATLIGRMIQEGYFALTDPAPVSEWNKVEDDPRGDIRIMDLLQMSSGLYFTAHRDPEAEQYTRYLDHIYIYTGAVDAFSYSTNRPLQFPVGTEGRYRNCDPLALGHIMRTQLEAKGEDYHTYPQRKLFYEIGIRRQVLVSDPYGNFLLTGYDYGTARNWARLALLHLNNGMWQGERLLPEDWSEFVSSRAPAWDDPIYGGLFWLNGMGQLPLPENTYYMAGAGGQQTIIVPDHDLIIVRMGHFRGSAVGTEALNLACAKLMEALGVRM
ncbi:MAG: serine hydrolase [Saprospiraceae bacterium]|nr:serine hydrolase [Saprospiraceae bacterium]